MVLEVRALGMAMAKAGARVLILEREAKFKDRVRGEFLAPWGVAEAQQLGVADLFRKSGHNVPFIEMGLGRPRDLPSTTPQGVPAIGVSHPEMQELLLQAAVSAAAHVRRGAVVTAVEPGQPPRVDLSWVRSMEIKERSPRVLWLRRTAGTPPFGNGLALRWSVTRIRFYSRVFCLGLAAPHDVGYYSFNPASPWGPRASRRRRSLSCLSGVSE